MLSKVSCEQRKEGDSHAVFNKMNKKMVHQYDKTEIILTNKTLDSQLCKRRNACDLRFLGEKKETSDETVKRLAEAVKSVKAVRRVIIELQG